jgi:hypothetical protein
VVLRPAVSPPSVLGVTLLDVEPLSPEPKAYWMASRADVSPPPVSAALPAGLDVAVAPVWPAALVLAVWVVAKPHS